MLSVNLKKVGGKRSKNRLECTVGVVRVAPGRKKARVRVKGMRERSKHFSSSSPFFEETEPPVFQIWDIKRISPVLASLLLFPFVFSPPQLSLSRSVAGPVPILWEAPLDFQSTPVAVFYCPPFYHLVASGAHWEPGNRTRRNRDHRDGGWTITGKENGVLVHWYGENCARFSICCCFI